MLANYHTHTWRCNHASGKESDYVRAAMDRGMQTLGFSDHTPYLFPGSYYSGFRMRPEELADYCRTVLQLRESCRGRMEILLGLEAEYYPGLFRRLRSFLADSPVEYLLLGQHFVGDEMGEHYSGAPTADDAILKRYCAQTMDAMQTGVFTYFAHPDLICYRGSKVLYREQMRRLCQEAKSCAMPLELNLLGLREKRNYPTSLFWELAAEEGCAVVLGVDAHESWHLEETETEEKAMEMVQSLGLELIPEPEIRRL